MIIAQLATCLAVRNANANDPQQHARRPNIILFLTDDQGYADVGCFGARGFETPNLDRLAREGRQFTDFYVAQAVCTASRAALMTGCYSNRVGLFGALNHESTTGINPDELLLSELLKAHGYSTAIYGKWHLGYQPMFLPTRNGFDDYFGIPYSNDNGPLHPIVRNIPPLPLYEGEQVIELDPDQSQFTRRFTERAVLFIERNKDRPFFLYLPHVMPHVPIFASSDFKGRTERGLYGDVIEELDWSMGQILDALARNDLERSTWIIFASDNGPFLSYGDHAGSAKPLREGKLTTWEGGMRVPCIMRWPGTIAAGTVCHDLVATIDLLPTVAGLLGASLPDRTIDGRDALPLIAGNAGAASPHEAYYYYGGDELQAVRSGDWKLHLPHDYLTPASPPGHGGKPANFENLKPESMALSGLRGIASRHGYIVAHTDLALYDLRSDPGETVNIAAEHPAIVARLQALAEQARVDLGDSLEHRVGANIRPAGKL
ncbi:MAG TPA: sulfatase [Pirellulales bacterium]|nr:sulfatase [Pirellulales bacterium]